MYANSNKNSLNKIITPIWKTNKQNKNTDDTIYQRKRIEFQNVQEEGG